MTVKKLIRLLNKYDSNKQVLIRAYEGGYNKVQKIKEMNIIPHHQQKHCFNGEFEEAFTKKEIEKSTSVIELYG